MRFWDTSALVPLVLPERSAPALLAVLADDRDQCVWWGSPVECASALARLEREGGTVAQAYDRLDGFAHAWAEVTPSDVIRRTAGRLLRTHPLCSADALQLAAAIVAAEGMPRSMPIVTLDSRLAEAAEREGFPVIGE